MNDFRLSTLLFPALLFRPSTFLTEHPLMALSLTVSLLIIGILLLLVLVFFAAYAHHKKSATSDIVLVGRNGQVESPLAPEGAVIVVGEMWRAVAGNGKHLPRGAQIRVCGVRGHLLVVEETINAECGTMN